MRHGSIARAIVLKRRDALKLGVGGALALSFHARATTQQAFSSAERKSQTVTRRFPAIELQAFRPALLALESGIEGYAIVGAGKNISLVWIRASGRIWAIGIDERELQSTFEVFPLAIESFEAVQARVAAWQPPVLPADTPEAVRHLMSMRPEPLKRPTDFQPWPLSNWRVEVLRRAEYIIENVDPGPTFGENPNAQAAARPGNVPAAASASCEVAVALLFTDDAGKRLLIGADWMPFNMVVTQDARTIDDYLLPCERSAARAYAAGLAASAIDALRRE